jgi:gamma-glutamylcyclotransferase
MLYFAYGSNMDWAQMKERCRSARFVGAAVLQSYRLAFTRKSLKRGCGVADAVPDDGWEIWGVVYEIDDLDIGRLDASEGYRPGRMRNSYFRNECRVLLDGDGTQPLTVFTYFGDPQPSPPLPNTEYMNHILTGAKHWHLPVKYMNELEQIETAV